jgi:hypothetical protein
MALRDLALDNMQQHHADRLLQKQEILKEILGGFLPASPVS